MSFTDITERLEAAKKIAKTSGAMIKEKQLSELGTSFKGKSDVVTLMDLESERIIKNYLHEQFPSDNFQGEETGIERYGDGGTWIIDPIDGTNNYVHGIAGYTISIAYETEKHVPLLGVVYSPVHDDLYWAGRGRGAYRNETRITCSSQSEVKDALTIISPPLRYPHFIDTYSEMIRRMCIETGDVRDFGSAALHLSYVADGKADCYFEYGLKYHDVAAGFVIVSEAGGRLSFFEPEIKFSGNIIVTNNQLHLWYTSVVREIYQKGGSRIENEKVFL